MVHKTMVVCEEKMTKTIGEALNDKLSNMNIQFEKVALELLKINEEEQDLKFTMKAIEIAKMNEIVNAVHVDTMKAKYKNQTERDVALQKSLGTSENYIEYKEKHKKLQQEVKNKTAIIDILKFQQRGVIAQLSYQVEFMRAK